MPDTPAALIPFDEKFTREDLFKPDTMTQIISAVTKKAKEHVPDLTTAKGRKAIASNAQMVARSKTFLDKQGKLLVDPIKAQAKEIDAERKRIRDKLDALKAEVRQPLTDWESTENERKERAHEKLAWLRGLPSFSVHDMDQSHIQALLDDARAAIINIDTFGDLNDQAENAKLVAIEALEIKLEERKKVDKDKAELEEFRRMKQEADERDRKELAERAQEKAKPAQESKKKGEEEAKKRREVEIREEERKRIAKEQQELAENTEHREQVQLGISIEIGDNIKISDKELDKLMCLIGINAIDHLRIIY